MRQVLHYYKAILLLIALCAVPVAVSAQSADDISEINRQERIQKRIDSAEQKLTQVQAKRVADRCKQAQTRVSARLEQAKQVQAKRVAVHEKFVTAITNAVSKGSDDSTSQTMTGYSDTIQSIIAEYTTASDAYISALADTASIDCVTNPQGFSAALNTSRAELKVMQAKSANLRSYVLQTVVPALRETKSNTQD